MPETIQGEFEKRLYLNTRIKAGGTYTTEGPHGLAFVEELNNNYITELPGESLTLGSTDQTVSIFVNGPAAFKKDGVIIEESTSTPSVTYNRLYNIGSELYWNGSKVGGNAYSYISENTTGIFLGPGPNSTANVVRITAQESILISGPNDSSITLDDEQTKISSVKNSLIFQGPSNSFFEMNGNDVEIKHKKIILATKTTINEGPSFGISLVGNFDIRTGGTSISDSLISSMNDDGVLDALHLENMNKVEIKSNNLVLDAPITISDVGTTTSYNYILKNEGGTLKWNNQDITTSGTQYQPKFITEDATQSKLLLDKKNETYLNDIELKISPSNTPANPSTSFTFNGPSLSLSHDYHFNEQYVIISTKEQKSSVFFQGPLGDIEVKPIASSMIFSGPGVYDNNSFNPSQFFIGPLQINSLPTAFVNLDNNYQQGKAVLNLRNNLYYSSPNHSMAESGPIYYYDYNAQSDYNQKINTSYIDVPHYYVDSDHKGQEVTLENNTIYIFDPDHDVNLTSIKIKHWNTPQLHLYFNKTAEGKPKMTFTYPDNWKWINETTPPTDSNFEEGHMYCITLRSVKNPVYDSTSETPPYNQEYIIIANIAYDVPIETTSAT